MPIASLVLVRHAESTWNVERRMQGHANPPLTAAGIAQAEALAARLREEAFDVIVASDLERALHTARALASARGLDVLARPEWREHDMGAWTGMTRKELKSRWPDEYTRYRSGDRVMSPGGGESREVFERRIRAARARLDDDFAGARVLVVTHRGALRVLAPEAKPEHAEPVRM